DPGLAQRALAAEEVLGRLVDEVDAAAWPADPHRRRGRVGHGAEPFLAFAQGGLGLAGVGDVHIDADLAQEAAVAIEPRAGVGAQHAPAAVRPPEPRLAGEPCLVARRGA